MPKHYLNFFRKASHRREDEFRPFDPTPDQIQAFHEQYEAALTAGQIVTDSLEKKRLVEWFRPVTYNNQGAMGQLPARDLIACRVLFCLARNPKIAGSSAAPPMAASSSFLKNSPVIVTPVASAKVLLTEQELTDYVNNGDVTDSSDEGFNVKYNMSGSMDWSPQTTSSASSIGQVSSYLTNLSPSSSLDSISSMPTGLVNSSPTRQRPSPRKSDGRAVAHFSVLVAETHGSPNHTFVLNIYNNHEAGLYKTHPEQHPVHQSPLADMLLPYHPAKDNYPCLACNCMYSLMGHQQHRHRSGRCTNNVDPPMIEEQDPPLDEVPFLKFRSYPADARIPSPQEFLNTLVGRAFVEWHSKMVSLKTFGLQSSQPNKAHHNEGGECQDIGQGQTSSILKGKGREMVLYQMD
ncbi:hypothetical protein B0H10DRAFT_1943179 [Mycena sp. CBHHK59/15]|nr:hypothetical protein B0H10DRAFT_1943179 [Mycena sp. CBHHK59/15]